MIDDLTGATLASASTVDAKVGDTRIDQAKNVGKVIADKAKELNIDTIVFDRSGYLYHGRVKAIADGARENGLKF